MKNNKFYLKAKTPMVRENKIQYVWKVLAVADNEEELEAMLDGKRKGFRIETSLKENSVVMCKIRHKESRKLLFAKRLIKIMQEKKVLRKDLPSLCGLTRANVSNYLSAKTIPREDSIKKLCQGLGVTRAELLGDES